MRFSAPVVLLILTVLSVPALGGPPHAAPSWTPSDLDTLRGLSLSSLPPVPPDPSNRVSDDPRAARLGQELFFDKRLSANGQVSCASCHQPDRNFTDGLPLARGVGRTARRTMTVVGTAYAPFLFWDGRADSQWAQALGPLESAAEHGADRTMLVRELARYRAEYEALFGPLPDLSGLPAHAGPVRDPAARANWARLSPARQAQVTRAFSNLGKAIAAFERQVQPAPARFDAYVRAALAGDRARMNQLMTPDEQAGLRLFLGDGRCAGCHSGPLLTDPKRACAAVRPSREAHQNGRQRHVRSGPRPSGRPRNNSRKVLPALVQDLRKGSVFFEG